MNYLIFLIIGFLVQLKFIKCVGKKQYIQATVFKAIASVIFVMTGIFTESGSMIIVGQLCGAIGDVFLETRHIVLTRNKVFTTGILFFTLEHFFFLVACHEFGKLPLLSLFIITILFILLIGAFTYPCIRNTGNDIRIYGIAYLLVVSLIGSFSLNTFITYPSYRSFAFLLASLLFVSSDIILAHNLFGNEKKWMYPASQMLYYLAQSLFVLSLIL